MLYDRERVCLRESTSAAVTRADRLGTSRSGCPDAGFTAPLPARGDGRFTHTVLMLNDGAGTTSSYALCPTRSPRSSGPTLLLRPSCKAPIGGYNFRMRR